MFADENVIRIKHDVLYEVAKLAFEGTLEEERDHLPRKMIPGPTPQFRCCVYKEREIIRQRIRLAEGKAPGPEDNGNVVQVISSACEDCPISSYVVTDNCQNCLGKACVNACKFGAISPGEKRSHIDAKKRHVPPGQIPGRLDHRPVTAQHKHRIDVLGHPGRVCKRVCMIFRRLRIFLI